MDKIVVALIALVFCFTLSTALKTPIQFDALYYQTQAQDILQHGLKLTDGATHPMFMPALMAGCMRVGVDPRILPPIFFAALLLVFYFGLRRLTSPIYAAFFTAVLTSFPLLWVHAVNLYCDLPEATLYLFGGILAYQLCSENATWRDYRRVFPRFLLAIACFSLGAMTKASGVALGFIAISVFCFPYFWGPLALMIAVIWEWAHFGCAWTGVVVGAPWANRYVPLTLPNEISLIIQRLFTYGDFWLLWFAVIFLTALGWRQVFRGSLKYLLAILTLDLGCLVILFANPNYFRWLIDGTLLTRLVLHFAPLALFYVALVGWEIIHEPT